MVIVIVLIGLCLIVGSAYFSGKSAMDAKKDMFCVHVDDNESLINVKLDLDKAGIFYSTMGRSPLMEAYNSAGTSQHIPGEVWILKKDISAAREIIKSKFEIEVTEFAIIVKDKATNGT